MLQHTHQTRDALWMGAQPCTYNTLVVHAPCASRKESTLIAAAAGERRAMGEKRLADNNACDGATEESAAARAAQPRPREQGHALARRISAAPRMQDRHHGTHATALFQLFLQTTVRMRQR